MEGIWRKDGEIIMCLRVGGSILKERSRNRELMRSYLKLHLIYDKESIKKDSDNIMSMTNLIKVRVYDIRSGSKSMEDCKEKKSTFNLDAIMPKEMINFSKTT